MNTWSIIPTTTVPYIAWKIAGIGTNKYTWRKYNLIEHVCMVINVNLYNYMSIIVLYKIQYNSL